MATVIRRKIYTTLTHGAAGKINHIQIRVEYEQADDLAPGRDPIREERLIELGAADMTAADLTYLTGLNTRIDVILERKDPLIAP